MFLLCLPLLRADVIHLKNGRTIVADTTNVNKDKVEYTRGENTYAIPKGSVDHIDAGGSSDVPNNTPEAPPIAVPMESSTRLDDLQHKETNLFENGAVNQSALHSIEATHDDQLIAQTYLIIGMHEQNLGNSASAHLAFSQALEHASGLGRMDDIIQTLLMHHLNAEAVRFGEAYVRLSPDSAAAYKWLGIAYFVSDRRAEAAKALAHSMDLHPDSQIAPLLERARRESSTEASFREESSGHFSMTFEGSAVSDKFKKSLLATLERDFDDLVSDLSISPHDRILVVLYTRQEFFDVTQARNWTGALNDGKLRIPVSGLDDVNSELAGVLKHELTHSFISQITHGNCPVWLNEGVAMTESSFSLGSQGAALARFYQSGHDVPLNYLEGSFMNFSTPQATLAYAESFAAVSYIRTQFGMEEVVRILKRLGQGEPIESAMRQTIHIGYADLGSGIKDDLTRQYGK